MDLKEIKKKKLRQKLAYLQTELEETKILYKMCLDKFNTDFRNYLLNGGIDPEVHSDINITKDPYDEIKTDIEEDTLKSVYRKVAGKTHPDKGGNKSDFAIANEANRNKDYGKLLEMADELGIKVPMDDKMMVEMDKQCSAVITSIENMKMTYAWMWVHTSGDSRENLKKFILQQLAVE